MANPYLFVSLPMLRRRKREIDQAILALETYCSLTGLPDGQSKAPPGWIVVEGRRTATEREKEQRQTPVPFVAGC
jgi:hypothetical protein